MNWKQPPPPPLPHPQAAACACLGFTLEQTGGGQVQQFYSWLQPVSSRAASQSGLAKWVLTNPPKTLDNLMLLSEELYRWRRCVWCLSIEWDCVALIPKMSCRIFGLLTMSCSAWISRHTGSVMFRNPFNLFSWRRCTVVVWRFSIDIFYVSPLLSI
jgi:hypothetical protein